MSYRQPRSAIGGPQSVNPATAERVLVSHSSGGAVESADGEGGWPSRMRRLLGDVLGVEDFDDRVVVGLDDFLLQRVLHLRALTGHLREVGL